MRTLIFRLIKILSPCLIISALGLEAWRVYAQWTGVIIPAGLTPVFWIGRVAIAGHLVEGGIAIALSPSRGQRAIPSGLYTFFTGFVGLVELLERPRLTPGETAIAPD